ncbi:F0F1 ATP synthase subunit B [Propylenella binzhouense]|uniref:F0F1 ATP synthase subunit B n=1 Tax=Propylenella binzhouense TaxID=2555902 RepID=UPI0031B5FE8C
MISPAYAQAHGETTETVGAAETHGGGHNFPPFDPATFGSQIFWLIISFGLLYYLMSKVALPRIATILEERNDRIADDLAEAERLKRETDEAIAAYEQALAEARQNAHGIAQEAREAAKAEIDADRSRLEGELDGKLQAAEARIGEIKSRALGDVDAIAKDAAEAIVEVLIGTGVARGEIERAVDAALSERAAR